MKSIFCSLLFVVAWVPLAAAQGTYTQIDVAGATGTYCYGASGAGDIVGIYGDTGGNQHGFLLSGGTYTTIDYPNTTITNLSGINDSGQIVGYAELENAVVVGFVYDVAAQTFTTVNYPHATATYPLAINDAGAITGFAVSGKSGVQVGFEKVGSKYRAIEPPGTSNAQMYGISTSGILAGFANYGGSYVSFVFKNRQYALIPGLGASFAIVTGINRAGTALAGTYANSGFLDGFIYQSKTLTTLKFPGADDTFAYGIADSGEVVGYFFGFDGVRHGFAWAPPADATK